MSACDTPLIERAGGVKFLMVMGCACSSSVLLWFDKLDAANYTLIVLSTVGAFIAGNAYITTRTAVPAAPPANEKGTTP